MHNQIQTARTLTAMSEPAPRPASCAAALASRRQALALGLALGMGGLAQAEGERAAPSLVSADFPGLITTTGADAPGPLGQFLIKLCRQAGWSLSPQFVPFARATLMARHGPRTLMAPLSRIPSRETQYQWVTTLFLQRYALLAARPRFSAGLPPLERLKSLRTLALRGSVSAEMLPTHGFIRIGLENSYEDMLRRLDDGSCDLIFGALPLILGTARHNGHALSQLLQGPVLGQAEQWLVASPDFPPQELESLRKAMAELRADGSHAHLLEQLAAEP